MPTYIPINSSSHQNLGWTKPKTFLHFAKQGALPLLLSELPHSLASFPIAFIPSSNQQDDVTFEIVALTSFKPENNLFISPKGHWLGGYQPAVLRSYPFRLIEDSQTQRQVLCIDKATDLTPAETETTTRFFTEEGELSKELKQIVTFLQHCERSRKQTKIAVHQLEAHGLIQPWPIKVQEGKETHAIEGLYRIKESALNSLTAESLKSLQESHALSVAYAQLFSQPRIQGLVRLQELHQKISERDQALSEADVHSYFEGKDDTLSFNF